MSTTAQKIAIMQAFIDGRRIEFNGSWTSWVWKPLIPDVEPVWNWEDIGYRIAPATKPSIDWVQVSPEWKWLAKDEKGIGYLFTSKPYRTDAYWTLRDSTASAKATTFASFQRGDCDWRESLVERPEGV